MTEPEGTRFTRDHEWARWDGDLVRVGISDYAQDAVGDLVFIDLPNDGAVVSSGSAVAEVESTKTVSSVLAPVSGEIVEVHVEIGGNPDLINSDPYGEGWMFAIRPSDPGEFDRLLDSAAYAQHVKEVSG